MSNPIMYVFWKYDKFPYVLGAKAEMLQNGNCYVPSYQMTVRRERIVGIYPVPAGEEIKKVLDRETARVQEEQFKVQQEAELRIGVVFHEYHTYRGIEPQVKG
jgi:hypothetical protein